MWVWGAVNAVLIMLVVYCNGRRWRGGWALGFAAQCWLILFGVLGAGPWTFVFSAGPAVMFAVNWWLHPRRVARRFAADAAVVRAAVAASHQQPSPVLGPHLGVSGEEALANIDKFMRDFNANRHGRRHGQLHEHGEILPPPGPLRPLPPPYSVGGLWPATWIHPWLAYDEEPATTPGPPLSDEEAKAKLAEYMTHLMENPWEGLKESVDRDIATAKLLGFYPAPPPQPGMSTDMIASTGTLSTPPVDPPGGCMICHADVPQTELIGHLISHHPDVYDGPFEWWPVDDTTEERGDKP